MKRGIIFLSVSVIFFLAMVSSSCDLNITMINQDPYPAVPGDYVKLLFQLQGVENSNCGDFSIELMNDYPIIFDPTENPIKTIKGGTFTSNYNSYLMVPYKIRVDKDALDGDNPIRLIYSEKGGTSVVNDFTLHLEDVKVDFEVFVKEYNPTTKELTLEILNIGENDIDALTIEIPSQESIAIEGSNVNIVGALDSNDYTTADFEAVLYDDSFDVNIYYSDEINERRFQTESVTFSKNAFENRGTKKGWPLSTYLLILLILFLFGRWYYKRRKHKHQVNQNKK